MDIIELAKEYSTHNELTETIVKELLHYEILKSIYSNKETLNTLAFQGGTALRLCYGGVRYSEDLDFCIANGKEFDISVMQKFKDDFTKSIMQKYGLQVEVKEPKQDNDSIVKKWVAKVFVPFPKGEKTPAIHIEVANINSYVNSARLIRNLYPKSVDEIIVRVESEKEILADKIIAFGDRDYMKYRDIWDIKYLQDKGIEVDIDLVIKKISDYNVSNLAQKLIAKLDEVNNSPEVKQKFYAELNRFLTKDFYEQITDLDFFVDVRKATNEVITQAIEQLKSRQQSKTPYTDKLKAMPKPSAEIEAKGKEFLNELRQSRNADSKNALDTLIFTDKQGNNRNVSSHYQDLWLKTFKLKSMEEFYTPKYSNDIKEALQNKEIRLTKGSLLKLAEKNRLQYIPQIKQTLDEPDIILKDIDKMVILAKRIDDRDFFASVNLETDDYFISISNAPKKEKVLKNKIASGAKIIYQSPNAKSIFYTETLLQNGKSPSNKIDSTNSTKESAQSQTKSKTKRKKK